MTIMYRFIILFLAITVFVGCLEKKELAKSSFGKMDDKASKAQATSVISMGRDDDDGLALKWHIGGGFDE